MSSRGERIRDAAGSTTKKMEIQMIKVVLIGAKGKMGQIAKQALQLMDQFSLVAEVNRGDNLDEILKKEKPHVALDVTSHLSVLENTWTILNNNVRPLIGTSGLSQEDINKIKFSCDEKKLGCLIIPNFSIAFAFINKISLQLAQYYDDKSIIEYHHSNKKDKPSGTARHTAKLIGMEESQIASVRAEGFIAKQQIYFQNKSERIVIDHESFSRESFLKGIQLSLQHVVQLNHLVVGLENILN